MKNNALVNVNCQKGTNNWTDGAELTMKRGALLTGLLVWFPPGVESQVYVRVLKAGAPLVPDTMIAEVEPDRSYGDGITGNRDFKFALETEIKKSEKLTVQYRNLDTSDVHEVMVNFEFSDLDTDKSRLRS